MVYTEWMYDKKNLLLKQTTWVMSFFFALSWNFCHVMATEQTNCWEMTMKCVVKL